MPFFLINQRQTVHFLTDSTLHFILKSVLQAGGNVAACMANDSCVQQRSKSRAGVGFSCRFVDSNSQSCALKGVETLRVAAGKEKHQHEARGHECCTETFIITTFFLRRHGTHRWQKQCSTRAGRTDVDKVRADDKRCEHTAFVNRWAGWCRLSFWWYTFTLYLALISCVLWPFCSWCMYSRFRWANVVNALNYFSFFPVPAWLFVINSPMYKCLHEFFKKRPVREAKHPRRAFSF